LTDSWQKLGDVTAKITDKLAPVIFPRQKLRKIPALQGPSAALDQALQRAAGRLRIWPVPDATKMHLIAIWLLASRSENKIPFDPKWVARRINATEAVDLELWPERGFILLDQELQTAEQVASKPQAECLSREREEGETEESPREYLGAIIRTGRRTRMPTGSIVLDELAKLGIRYRNQPANRKPHAPNAHISGEKRQIGACR
jgi:hypothetical protein